MDKEQSTYMYGKYDGVDDTVNIPRGEYEDLLEDSRWLACLQQAGVDNWDGTELAQEIYDTFNNAQT